MYKRACGGCMTHPVAYSYGPGFVFAGNVRVLYLVILRLLLLVSICLIFVQFYTNFSIRLLYLIYLFSI